MYRRGQPVWKHQDKNFVLYLSSSKKWYITEKTNFDEDNLTANAFTDKITPNACPYNGDYAWTFWNSDNKMQQFETIGELFQYDEVPNGKLFFPIIFFYLAFSYTKTSFQILKFNRTFH